MKTSHAIAISATTSSTILIGFAYAPETTHFVFAGSLATVMIAMLITYIAQVIKETI